MSIAYTSKAMPISACDRAKQLGLDIADQKVALEKVEKTVEANTGDIDKMSNRLEDQNARLSEVKHTVEETQV